MFVGGAVGMVPGERSLHSADPDHEVALLPQHFPEPEAGAGAFMVGNPCSSPSVLKDQSCCM